MKNMNTGQYDCIHCFYPYLHWPWKLNHFVGVDTHRQKLFVPQLRCVISMLYKIEVEGDKLAVNGPNRVSCQ